MTNDGCRLGIVVLNYENYEETINCVRSIERFEECYDYIVIVDNGSKNHSADILKKTFAQDNIIVLSSKDNRGFAQGNNLGISFLRKKKKAEFVLLLNSDTEITRNDYIGELLKEYKKGVAVIGSHVKMPNGELWGAENEDLTLSYSVFQACMLFCRLNYIPFPLKYLRNNKKEMRIHGCAIMLTPDYFLHYKILWPFTFLYREEMILSIMCRKAGVAVAVSDAIIWHKVGGSSSHLGYSTRNKRKYDHQSAWQQVMVSFMPYWLIKALLDGGEKL